jgi:ankyrin repeat protein
MDTVTLLIDRGAHLEVRDSKAGLTALISPATKDRTGMIRVLLDRGADIYAKVNDGKTALILAAFLGNTETVKLLLEKAADVNDRNKGDCTALFLTKAAKKSDVAEILKKAGAV